MKIRVLLFAAAKQISGASMVELEFVGGSTIADVRTALIRWCPELECVVGRSVFAVDGEYAAVEQVIGERSEVALIPPVSGG